jgi:glycosidase
LLAYTQRLISLRRQYTALRRGRYQTLCAQDGIYAFVRELQGEHFVIVLNVSRQPVKLELSTAALPMLQGEFEDLLHGFSARVDRHQFTGSDLPARSGAVFKQYAS